MWLRSEKDCVFFNTLIDIPVLLNEGEFLTR